jgi:hypothetical protein
MISRPSKRFESQDRSQMVREFDCLSDAENLLSR